MGKRESNRPNALDCLKRVFQPSQLSATSGPQDSPRAMSPSISAGTVLIVEAGEWNCGALHSQLEQAGYAAQVAQEASALEALKREPPALLIVGGMPDPCLYRTLRRASSAPILALIPQGDEDQVLAAFAAGVDQCQTGHISGTEVVARARVLLRRGT
jgi:DNA-binding response OmpR family regulator